MEYFSESEQQTRQIAAAYAKTLTPGDVVAIKGDLGAGKTAFVKGLAEGLGRNVRVQSPTYAYMNDYGGLYHFDCYRLSSGEDCEALGLTDYFYADGICAVEWAENVADVLPQTVKTVRIEKTGEFSRKITIEGNI